MSTISPLYPSISPTVFIKQQDDEKFILINVAPKFGRSALYKDGKLIVSNYPQGIQMFVSEDLPSEQKICFNQNFFTNNFTPSSSYKNFYSVPFTLTSCNLPNKSSICCVPNPINFQPQTFEVEGNFNLATKFSPQSIPIVFVGISTSQNIIGKTNGYLTSNFSWEVEDFGSEYNLSIKEMPVGNNFVYQLVYILDEKLMIEADKILFDEYQQDQKSGRIEFQTKSLKINNESVKLPDQNNLIIIHKFSTSTEIKQVPILTTRGVVLVGETDFVVDNTFTSENGLMYLPNVTSPKTIHITF